MWYGLVWTVVSLGGSVGQGFPDVDPIPPPEQGVVVPPSAEESMPELEEEVEEEEEEEEVVFGPRTRESEGDSDPEWARALLRATLRRLETDAIQMGYDIVALGSVLLYYLTRGQNICGFLMILAGMMSLRLPLLPEDEPNQGSEPSFAEE